MTTSSTTTSAAVHQTEKYSSRQEKTRDTVRTACPSTSSFAKTNVTVGPQGEDAKRSMPRNQNHTLTAAMQLATMILIDSPRAENSDWTVRLGTKRLPVQDSEHSA